MTNRKHRPSYLKRNLLMARKNPVTHEQDKSINATEKAWNLGP